MNVLFVVSSDYPDANEVWKRIMKGAKTEHTTWIRPNDHLTRDAFEFVQAPYEKFESKYGFTGEALMEEMLHEMDYAIVYGTDGSAAAKWYKKVSKWPYDRVFCKIDLHYFIKPKKQTKSNRRAE